MSVSYTHLDVYKRQDVNTVRLMGIDANRIISLVFALGSSLAALGGVFYSISYPTICLLYTSRCV